MLTKWGMSKFAIIPICKDRYGYSQRDMYSKIMFLVCGCHDMTKIEHENELEKKGHTCLIRGSIPEFVGMAI